MPADRSTPRSRAQAEQLASLQRLTARLSAAVTVREVAAVVLTDGIAVLRAGGAILSTLEGDALVVVHTVGYPKEIVQKWERVPLGEAFPMTDALRSRAPLWLETPAARDARYPVLAGLRAYGAWAVLPLVVEGRALGVLTVSFTRARSFLPGEREFILTVAELCAQAIDRARLYEAERAGRLAAERLALLLESAEVIERSTGYDDTVANLASFLVPRLADWCSIDLVDDAGQPKLAALAHIDPEKIRWGYELRRRYPPEPEAPTGLHQVLRTGEPELYPEISDAMIEASTRDPERLRIVRELGMSSVIFVPLTARGRRLGVLTLISTRPERRYDEADLNLAKKVASRAALALDNAQLIEAERAARRAREEILAVVSHDLRNPLGVISMNTELTLKNAPPGEAGEPERRRAQRVQKAARWMETLIRDLLDASSIDAGRLSIHVEAHDAGAIAGEVVEMLGALATQKGLRVDLEVDAASPAVRCDRDRVVQVLSNLLSNAIKFTPDGGEIRVGVRGAADGVTFTVSDTGPGIAGDQLPRIFDRYWSGRGKAGADTGLGLYIAKGIVDAHGGRLWVESDAGRGSTFSVLLPRSLES